jgi:GLPGLI family protein
MILKKHYLCGRKKNKNMKRINCIIMSILFSTNVLNAQNITVVYQEQRKAADSLSNLDPQIAAIVKAQLNKINKTMVLYSEKGASLFEQLTQKDNAQSELPSNVQVVQVGVGNCYYKDRAKNESIAQEYIMDKAFLITEPLHSQWTLSSEEKTVGNYVCKKAVNDKDVTAWYCPDIPVSDGPYLYCGLPGLILEIETSTNVITMQTIDFNTDIKDKIKPPTSGKKINREEFNETRDKKLKEYGVDGKKSPVTVIQM